MKIEAPFLGICITFIFLILAGGLYAATIEDKIGDFGNTDVSSVQVDIKGAIAVFTVTYSEEVIDPLWGGVGGIFGIDSDRSMSTGLDGSRGFDAQLTYNVLALAPTAQLDIWVGPNAGKSVKIGSGFGNGTDLSFTDRSVTLAVPLQFLGTNGDFDFALFATGLFSAGDKWDRVPDQGVARSLTGEVSFLPVSGNKTSHAFLAQPARNRINLVRSVTTSVEGENAVWNIQTGRDLPGNSFSDDSMTMTLLIDVDRRLETGMESSEIPFLPFGADRNVRCTFTPGGAGSIDIVTGIKDNGERTTQGGGAGVNDLSVSFDRRLVRLVVPLWLLGLNTTAFDWMLVTNSTDQGSSSEVFLNTSIHFDAGEPMLPLGWPPNVTTITDSLDAKNISTDPRGNRIKVTRTLPNSELRQLRSAIRPGYLMAQITYEYPITMEPYYFTALHIFMSGNRGIRRQFLANMNWHTLFGGQVVLRELTEGADVTRSITLNQCLATNGKNVSLLLPEEVFGANAFKQVQLFAETSQTSYSVGVDRQATLSIDRLPDNGTTTLLEQ